MLTRIDYPALGETLYTGQLPNGLRLRVVPKPGCRKTFAVLAADYGAADRRFSFGGETYETPAGTAHYLEHKLFDTPDGDMMWQLEALGVDVNAFTSDTVTACHIECAGRFDEALRSLLTVVPSPYFSDESVARERDIITQEIRMVQDDPDEQVYLALMRCLFERHPLRDDIAGTEESIARITPALLRQCHALFYRPSNLALCVVGAAEPEAVAALAEELLPPELERVPIRDYGAPEGLSPVAERAIRVGEIAAPLFAIGTKLGPSPTGDALLRERVLSSLALSCLCGRSSPFYQRCYEQGLLNATFAAQAAHPAGQELILFEGEAPQGADAVLEALCRELDRVATDGLDEALFARVQKAAWGNRLRGLMNFSALGVDLAACAFRDCCPLDAFEPLAALTCQDAETWLREELDPARFAMSVMEPK